MQSLASTQNDWFARKFNSTFGNETKDNSNIILGEIKRIPGERVDKSTKAEDLNANILDLQSRIVRRPSPVTAKGRFLLLQQWEGYVIKIFEETFTALVYDKTNPANDPEEVELLAEDVSLYDRSLFQEGAVFYWSIGYSDLPNGQRIRASNIRFRRVPAWSHKDMKRIKEKASELKSFFKSMNPNSINEFPSL